jgi:hypothetical protein
MDYNVVGHSITAHERLLLAAQCGNYESSGGGLSSGPGAASSLLAGAREQGARGTGSRNPDMIAREPLSYPGLIPRSW